MRYDPHVRLSSTERQVKNWLNFVSSGTGAAIKSIQTGSISMSTTSQTATITAVDTANSLLIWNGASFVGATSTVPNAYGSRLTFTNSTTITATTNAVPTGVNGIVYFTVIEFNPGVLKSVQRGTIATSTSPATATITSVNTAKAIVMFLGDEPTYSATSAVGVAFAGLQLTNATTVTAVTQTGAVTTTVGFQVAEWN